MKPATFFADEYPIVIAEIGGNHGGDLDLAKVMVDAAAGAGAKFVKFQTYLAERLISPNEPACAEFEREMLSFDEFHELSEHCRLKGIVFLSTPFDEESADFLDKLGVPAFKIASGDITHVPLLQHVAGKQKPILLSTGASTWAEMDTVVRIIRNDFNVELVLLHCIAAYPTPDNEANLRIIPEMAARYGLPVGFSDHTIGIDVALGAVALGACVIEKHFTVDQTLPGGDNDISILPDELARLIEGSRRISTARGLVKRQLTSSEVELRPLIRRSLVAKHDLNPGHVISEDDVLVIRPGTGTPPSEIDNVVGRVVKQSVRAFEML